MTRKVPKPGSKVRGSSTGQPLNALLDLLGRRGTLRIMWELRHGTALTFRALAAASALPPGTLNTRIAELRETGLIALDGGYQLSRLGRELAAHVAPLWLWADRWAEELAKLEK